MKDTVAVVILNYNGIHFLKKFLPGVLRFSSAAEVYVVDNGSTDDSISYLNSITNENFFLITLPENKGFCGGYNEALKRINARYYVLLNSDIEVSEGWIGPVIEYMDAHPQAGIAQPKIKSYQDKDKFEYAGAGGGYLDKLGYPFCRGRIFNAIEADTGQYDDIEEVFWASGACMFVQAELFHQLGGFDTHFFAHMEEIDLCWRAQQAGFKVVYVGKSKVYHVGGGTLPKSNPKKTYLNFRNNLIMLYKNLSPYKAFKVILIRLFLDALAAFYFLFSGFWKDFFMVIKAHFAFYAYVINHRKRKKYPVHDVKISKINVVYQHFFLKKKKFTDLDCFS